MKTRKPQKPQTKFTDKLFFEICDMISETSLSITTVCKKLSTSHTQFYKYLNKSIKLNETQKLSYYTRAREAQADLFFNKMISRSMYLTTKKKVTLISHEEIQANKLMIDTLKFAVAKLNPRKYSDTLNLNNKIEKKEIDFSEFSKEDLKKFVHGK